MKKLNPKTNTNDFAFMNNDQLWLKSISLHNIVFFKIVKSPRTNPSQKVLFQIAGLTAKLEIEPAIAQLSWDWG